MQKEKQFIPLSLKDITLIGVMVATMQVAKISLSFLPNIELVSLFIILYTLFFEKKVIYVIFIFTIIEGLLYGFSLWWYSYLYIWYLLAGITYLFRKYKSAFVYATIACIYGLCFGILFMPITFLANYMQGGLAYSLRVSFTWWVAGIPWDMVHGISNFFVVLILYYPLLRILKSLRNKHLL